MNQPVWALAATNYDLYVGGNFAVAGGQFMPAIARAHIQDAPVISTPSSDSSHCGFGSGLTAILGSMLLALRVITLRRRD